ncbi:MmgE/PrpD family protein [Pseudochelatococcus lubricantis]|uniref:MmgE/PrpD family protein n=1 Tax=Pseudochelatococcus lubricantis TaxID=1538102 RepID=UPI0035E80106
MIGSEAVTRQVVDLIAGVRFDLLSPETVAVVQNVLVDTLGVIVAGIDEPLGVCRIICDHIEQMGGNSQATVFGTDVRTSVVQAAFANGIAAHALDFDSTFFPLTHPSSPTIPAILAVAEWKGLPGTKVIEAIAVAFELQGRMRLAAHGWSAGQGFHKPGVVGTLGAAAGVAKLLELPSREFGMALGLAGSRAGALAVNTGTMTKSSHAGHAARMGVECALLAQAGWTATEDVFGEKGILDTFVGTDVEYSALTENFGDPFYMVSPGVGFKKYPCNYFTHRVIDAALHLRAEMQIEPDEIEQVIVTFPRFDYVNRPAPRSGLDAKFSVQYTAAIALLDGVVGVDSFSQPRRDAVDVASLLPRVSLVMDDAIPSDFMKMWCDVEIRMRGGRAQSKTMKELTGWIGSPLPREALISKFRSCVSGRISAASADAVLLFIENLSLEEDVSVLASLLRTGNQTNVDNANA